MKKLGMLFALIAVMLLAFTGCSEAPTGSAAGGKKVVKVGVLGALTGDVATVGESAVKAMELAAEEFNARQDELQVRLVIEDTKCEGAVSATAANKLVNVDKVDFIIGPLCSVATAAAAPIAESSEVVMMSGCSTAASIADAGDFIFRTSPSDVYQGKFTAEYFFNELGVREAGIIYSNDDWSFGIKQNFQEEFEALGGKIVATEATEREVQDLRSQLTKVASKNPEIIYTPLYSNNVGVLLKQAKEMGVEIPMFGADASYDPNLLDVAGDAAEGYQFISPKSTKAPELEKALQEKKGVNIELCTGFSYDAANIMFNTAEKAGTNSAAIKEGLYALEGHDGVTGTITFDENGDRVGAEYSVFEVQNGEFVEFT
jgi:branched-chain amino acid transport system substrate-binding protein